MASLATPVAVFPREPWEECNCITLARDLLARSWLLQAEHLEGDTLLVTGPKESGKTPPRLSPHQVHVKCSENPARYVCVVHAVYPIIG